MGAERMRIEQLKYFVEVARCGSIRKASEHLFMAQQSLSQSVKKLETELGVSLLERSLGGVTLTREGEAVLSFAEAVLAEQDKLYDLLRDIAEKREEESLEGELNIYAFGAFDYYLLPEVLRVYRQKYPGVKLHSYTADFEIIDNILEQGWGSQNLGLIVLSDVTDMMQYELLGHQDITFLPLVKGEYRFYCGRSHPLAVKRKISLEEVISYPIVYHGISGFENGALYHILCQYGKSIPDVQVDVMPINICLNLIASGESLGFLNEYLFEGLRNAHLPGVEQITALTLDITFPCILGCIHGENISLETKRFIELLKMKV